MTEKAVLIRKINSILFSEARNQWKYFKYMPSVDVTNWWIGLKMTEKINNQVRARELSGNVKQRSFRQQKRPTICIRDRDRDHKTPSLARLEIFPPGLLLLPYIYIYIPGTLNSRFESSFFLKKEISD